MFATHKMTRVVQGISPTNQSEFQYRVGKTQRVIFTMRKYQWLVNIRKDAQAHNSEKCKLRSQEVSF